MRPAGKVVAVGTLSGHCTPVMHADVVAVGSWCLHILGWQAELRCAWTGTHMGKVLIQMAADADAEVAAPAPAPAFTWPAPPAKAPKEADEADAEEGVAEEEAAAESPFEEAEPEAKPVFFCKCAPFTHVAVRTLLHGDDHALF